MKTIRILAWVVIAIMGASGINVALNSGFDHGVGLDTFLAGAKDPWQMFIGNDMTTGLFFMAAWIIFREQGSRGLHITAWIWMLMWWGNIVAATYILRALSQSDGDWRRFFLGRREGALVTKPIPAPLRIVALIGAVAVAAYLAVSLQAVGFTGIAAVGYLLGFLPIILSLTLIGLPERPRTAAAA